MKYILLAILLAGCGGMPPDTASSTAAQITSDQGIKTCMQRAVRSRDGSYNSYSVDGGATWRPGVCPLPGA